MAELPAEPRAHLPPVRGRVLCRALRWLPAAAAGLLFIYCGIGVRYWTNRPVIKRHYVAKWNQKILATPEDQRAWPKYREAISAVTPVCTIFDDAKPEWVLTSPKAREFIVRNQAALAKFRLAAKLPALGCRVDDGFLEAGELGAVAAEPSEPPPDPRRDENKALVDCLLSQPAVLASPVIYLLGDALLANERGDQQRAVENVVTALQIAQHRREVSSWVNEMASVRSYSHTLRLWGKLISDESPRFAAERLLTVEQQLRAYAGGDLAFSLQFERDLNDDIIQRCFAEDGRGDGYFFAPGMPNWLCPNYPTNRWWFKFYAPLTTHDMPSRAKTKAMVDKYWDQVAELWSQPLGMPHDWSKLASNEPLPNTECAREFFKVSPVVEACFLIAEEVTQQRDALLLGSAALRFKLATGDWPAESAELVPNYLAHIPLDRWTGEPLRYRLVNGRPVIYSLGRDKIDQQGQPARVDIDLDTAIKHQLAFDPQRWQAFSQGVDGFEPDALLLHDETALDVSPPPKLPLKWTWQLQGVIDLLPDDSQGDWVLWPVADPWPAR